MTVKGKYGGRKVRDGTVVSDKMQKTLLVAVEEHLRHPLYKKRVRRLHRFMAHDEREEGKMGDRVRIVEAAPISRKKRWKLVEVLQRAELPDVAPESIDLDLLGEVKREEEASAETMAAVPEEPAPADAQAPEEASGPEAVAEEITVEEVAGEVGEEEPIEAPTEEATLEVEAEDEPEAIEASADEPEAIEASADEPETIEAPADEPEAIGAPADEADDKGTKE